MNVRFPGGCITVAEGRTPEQVRTALVGLGHTTVQNATYTRETNGDLVFSAPQGGAKG